MSFNGPIVDRLAIRELVATYGNAVTERDADAWGALWAENSIWSLPGVPGMERVEGRTAIVAAWIEGMKQFPFQVNIQTPGSLSVHGDTASGRCYTHERVKDLSGQPAIWINVYKDDYVKIDGQWLFKSRTLDILDITTG
jgi:ketosteroid isomerase-like protein